MENSPSSAYRLQLNEEFPLSKAMQALDYITNLGIDAIYLSPIAKSHSSHGYDIVDSNVLNPKLGSEQELEDFFAHAHALGLKIILDVVPNHMGICGGNLWWEDVLKYGEKSKYASFFDIEWNPEKLELKGRILLPILGDSYGAVLEREQIHLDREKKCLTYGEYELPLTPKSYKLIPKKVTPEALDKLLEAQHYRLALWKVAAHEINYRRFFNIHELAAIRIEDERVLKAHHRWIFELMKSGKIDGLRIDHPDGLYDPKSYFKRLRKQKRMLTLVEKILDRKEQLPPSWDVDGSVGYEYLNQLTTLFVDAKSGKAFTKIYESFIHRKVDLDEIIYTSKRYFTDVEMVSEVEALALALDRLSENDRHHRDFTRLDLTHALADVIASFPIYRTYITPDAEITDLDKHTIKIALEHARGRNKTVDPSIFTFIEYVLLSSGIYREFTLRFQQLTGPLMAKGVEDTTFYRYNRFIALNEVGGDPKEFGSTPSSFHTFNMEKLKKWPCGFLASSTHDTKRSEDVRMRLVALSEMPERFEKEIRRWSLATESIPKPSPNAEYFIYQTLIGSWPISFERVWAVVLKSLREAKEETSWARPNLAYEQVTHDFVQKLLLSPHFLEIFTPFQAEIAKLGELNSLSALTLKLGSCGIFELYQGNEAFTYRLVDPDNRAAHTFESKGDEKERITRIGLNYRKAHPDLFLKGSYTPLDADENLIAFAREQELIVVASRFHTRWSGGHVRVPKQWIGRQFIDLFSQNRIEIKAAGEYGQVYLSKEQSIGFYEKY